MPKGDCYEAACRYMGDHPNNPDLVLVHAMVTGRKETEGIRHGHAFVLNTLTGMVFDDSNDKKKVIPAVVYISVGEITTKESHVYTHQDMRKELLKHEHWGPWTPMKEYKMKHGKEEGR